MWLLRAALIFQKCAWMLHLKKIFYDDLSLVLLHYSFFMTIYRNIFCISKHFQLKLYWWGSKLIEIYTETNYWISAKVVSNKIFWPFLFWHGFNKFEKLIYHYSKLYWKNLLPHKNRQGVDWSQSCRNQQPHFFHSIQMRTWSLPLSPQ